MLEPAYISLDIFGALGSTKRLECPGWSLCSKDVIKHVFWLLQSGRKVIEILEC